MTRHSRLLVRTLVAAVAFVSWPLRAQGNLSTQGLGYPQGQLSTQALSMGGATAESDAMSPLNPAALSLLPAAVFAMQVEPEYRTVTVGAVRQRTSISRFPLFFGAMPFGPRWTGSLSASSLLDRTWTTTTADTQQLGDDVVTGRITQRSEGAITDVRLAAAYHLTEWLRIGLGGHGMSGRVLLSTARAFDDTARFTADTQSTTLGFSGNAVSIGGEAAWARKGAIGVSYRRGGKLRAYSDDDVVGSGSAPDHMGVSFIYLGLRGTTLGLRVARDSWSRLEGLATTLNVHEGLDIGVGGETTGPKFGGGPVSLRAGVRFRTLPFSSNNSPVEERSLSGGMAFPMAGGRVQVNVGGVRSSRSADVGVSETAWTLSTGLTVRP
jgi:hypothetical protein